MESTFVWLKGIKKEEEWYFSVKDQNTAVHLWWLQLII